MLGGLNCTSKIWSLCRTFQSWHYLSHIFTRLIHVIHSLQCDYLRLALGTLLVRCSYRCYIADLPWHFTQYRKGSLGGARMKPYTHVVTLYVFFHLHLGVVDQECYIMRYVNWRRDTEATTFLLIQQNMYQTFGGICFLVPWEYRSKGIVVVESWLWKTVNRCKFVVWTTFAV